MTSDKHTSRPTTVALSRCGILAGLYTILIFALPASTASMKAYDLSAVEYHILLFAVLLPSMLVWFAAFYGYAKLQEYAQSIRKAPESDDFSRLATGCMWLAWSLPLPAILALILNAIANSHPDLKPSSIIIANYVSLILPLVAFSIIGSAAKGLMNRSQVRFSIANARAIVLLFVAAGVLFCYLTFRRFGATSLGSTDNPYFLPLWLLLLTIIIPYLYAWFVGTLAAYEINIFSKNVKGLLYRQPLRLLAVGLVVVIVSLIALQYIGSVQPRTGYLALNYKLLSTTIFRILGGLGFVLLAIAASRLKKIEDV